MSPSPLESVDPRALVIVTLAAANQTGAEVLSADISAAEILQRSSRAFDNASKRPLADLVKEAPNMAWEIRGSKYAQRVWTRESVLLRQLRIWPGMDGMPTDFAVGSPVEFAQKLVGNLTDRRISEGVKRFIKVAEADPSVAKAIVLSRPLIVSNAEFVGEAPAQFYSPGSLQIEDGCHRAVVAAYLGLSSFPELANADAFVARTLDPGLEPLDMTSSLVEMADKAQDLRRSVPGMDFGS